MNRLQTFFIALVLSVNFSGCAFLPSNFALFSTGANLALTAATGKSTSEHVADGVTQLDCQWSRIFSDWKVCLTHEEYVTNLMIMNCNTYSWNFLNIPYCKEND
jgi:hypothetical protein|tara:strand:- start:562 stop:873 length:312 start_codon:yes stop_codon:yes gene_type:complete